MSALLHSYLFVWLFCLALCLGSLANLMLHQLTGGRWGEALGAPLSAAVALMPFVSLAALPLLIDLPALFHWMADPASVAQRRWWLNRPFFLARAALYLLLWSALSLRWRVLAARSSTARSAGLIRLSAPGLILYGFSVSAAAVDWIMSLTPRWYSSTFGLWIAVACMQGALAFAVCAWLLPRMRSGVRSESLRLLCGDFANLLLMYVLALTYLSYTQYLIVWAEDLPHEIAWYLPRLQSSWRVLTLALILLQFLLPFALLLIRGIKRDARALAAIAATLLVTQLLLFFYLVAPTFAPQGLTLQWSDPLLVLLCVGAWFLAWRRRWTADAARAL
jgi:hypothetical protein